MKNLNIFQKRRERFFELLSGNAAIIPAASLVVHHADCEYPFRQNSDFWYLTGFDEPNAVALFLPHFPIGERFILFVMPKQISAEIWTGFRWGVEGAQTNFGADIAHSIEELEDFLPRYLEKADGISFRVGKNPKLEAIVLKTWSSLLNDSSRKGYAPAQLLPPCPLLHQLRLKKDKWEIASLRKAAEITSKAHELARATAKPGMFEKQIQALIEHYFLDQGARGPAYGSIVASGENACILHYVSNQSQLRGGDLLLIDAGCSTNDYYNADITRTFPISGSFSSEQRNLYQIVLAAQQAAIKSVVTGSTTDTVHMSALRVLVEGLLDLGLLKGNIDSIIEQGAYRHFYMHRTGHWLGLDVHDAGAYRLGDYEVELEKGMVLTVEPGLYISDFVEVPEDQPEVPERWKGIGIRIEDDVLVDESFPEVLTSGALKEIKDMEN